MPNKKPLWLDNLERDGATNLGTVPFPNEMEGTQVVRKFQQFLCATDSRETTIPHHLSIDDDDSIFGKRGYRQAVMHWARSKSNIPLDRMWGAETIGITGQFKIFSLNGMPCAPAEMEGVVWLVGCMQ